MCGHQRAAGAAPDRKVAAVYSEACFVAPSPELEERMREELERVRGRGRSPLRTLLGIARKPRTLGFDDGVIFPADEYPTGTPEAVIRAAAAERAPLRGSVRVVVVLVDFTDRAMTASADHFRDLFFSTGVMQHGSVREYFREVTNNQVDIVGEVVGPLRMPQTLAWYANGNFGIGRPSGTTRARNLANDAAVAADPTVNFGPYDNDGNGFVDAFIVVHAGRGGEETGNGGDIWSHKWVMPGVYNADGTQIYAYLTIPEDAKIGVCAHELGHLVFGFPDLYDTDDTSEGVGRWCLMGGGSWNGGGDIPAHPSAWCKANQGWASVTNVTTSSTLSIPDVKASRNIFRVWKNGASGPEYFLLENRQRTGFDAELPGDGLLIWHIDENQPGNTDENHYKVGLIQADNQRHLELMGNRGDGGDPYPGTANNTSLTASSAPSSRSFTGQDTCVSITNISPSSPTMSAAVSVACGKAVAKEFKDRKDTVKDGGKELPKELKEGRKEFKELKEGRKDFKELKEGGKDIKEFKEGGKDIKEFKEGGKDIKEVEWPGRPGDFFGQPPAGGDMQTAYWTLEARVAALEQQVGGTPAPFIGSELRPDLIGGPSYGGADDELNARMAAGDWSAKRSFDTRPGR